MTHDFAETLSRVKASIPYEKGDKETIQLALRIADELQRGEVSDDMLADGYASVYVPEKGDRPISPFNQGYKAMTTECKTVGVVDIENLLKRNISGHAWFSDNDLKTIRNLHENGYQIVKEIENE